MAAHASDLCLATTVAADLGIASDATVQRVVTAASKLIAKFCARTFEKGTAIVEYPAGYGRSHLIVDRAPILSITSIVELGETLAAGDYTIAGTLAAEGMIYRLDATWPFTGRTLGRITDSEFAAQGVSGDDGITVTYAGGYATPGQNSLEPLVYTSVTVPEDLQEAAILASVAMYRRRGIDPNVASESIGDWSVSYQGTNTVIGRGGALPEAVQAMLAAGGYVRHRVS